MANPETMRGKGYRSFMVWIPCGLHQAVRDKLYGEHLTAQKTMIKILTLWSGWKDDRRTDPPNVTPET